MVKVEDKTIYICPYCRSRHDSEIDAEDCRDECIKEDMDDIEEDYETTISCEMCGKEFEEEVDAVRCEHKHKEKDDMKYAQFIYKQNREKLDKASKHKHQTKLK